MTAVRNMAQGITSLARLRSAIRALPLRIRTHVANEAEKIFTSEEGRTFDAGQTVYNEARPKSVAKGNEGRPLSLRKSGSTRSSLRFVAIGTIVRAHLAKKYQRYLIGKYRILPQRLPVDWRVKLEELVSNYAEKFSHEVAS